MSPTAPDEKLMLVNARPRNKSNILRRANDASPRGLSGFDASQLETTIERIDDIKEVNHSVIVGTLSSRVNSIWWNLFSNRRPYCNSVSFSKRCFIEEKTQSNALYLSSNYYLTASQILCGDPGPLRSSLTYLKALLNSFIQKKLFLRNSIRHSATKRAPYWLLSSFRRKEMFQRFYKYFKPERTIAIPSDQYSRLKVLRLATEPELSLRFNRYSRIQSHASQKLLYQPLKIIKNVPSNFGSIPNTKIRTRIQRPSKIKSPLLSSGFNESIR